MLKVSDKPLIIIAGPTAVGKSALGIALAKKINGEIISADSMQVYRKMDIGTAKVTQDEMDGIPHHLIDILDPTEPFHVFDFKQRAKNCVEEIYERNHVPIVVGGTGFYVQALLYDIDFSEHGQDDELRESLQNIANNEGPEALHDILKQLDPQTAKELHPNNVKRVIRSIEYAKQNGKTIYDHNKEQRSRVSPYNFFYFVLNDDRETVYKKINERVDVMIANGLVEEVQHLVEIGCTADMTSMQGIGYKQVLKYFNGEYTYDQMIDLIKRDSRHLAKRQLTWFNRESCINWIDKKIYKDIDEQIKYITDILEKNNGNQ